MTYWLEMLFDVYGCSEQHRGKLINEIMNSEDVQLNYKIAAC